MCVFQTKGFQTEFYRNLHKNPKIGLSLYPMVRNLFYVRLRRWDMNLCIYNIICISHPCMGNFWKTQQLRYWIHLYGSCLCIKIKKGFESAPNYPSYIFNAFHNTIKVPLYIFRMFQPKLLPMLTAKVWGGGGGGVKALGSLLNHEFTFVFSFSGWAPFLAVSVEQKVVMIAKSYLFGPWRSNLVAILLRRVWLLAGQMYTFIYCKNVYTFIEKSQ